MRPRSLLSHTAVLALLVATPALAEPPTLERVVLSTGGVGFFSYGADVETDGRLGITLPIEQIDDVLRSLTLFDAQGAVQGISLPGATPWPTCSAMRPSPRPISTCCRSFSSPCAVPQSRRPVRRNWRAGWCRWCARRSSDSRRATG